MSVWSLRLARYGRWYPAIAAGIWAVIIFGSVLKLWRPGANMVITLFAILVLSITLAAWAAWRREQYIREAALPQFLKRKLREHYPQLSGKDTDLVERGLRQFFLACNRSKGGFVAMPSKVVDAMWHEFILHTRGYKQWCLNGLGRFLHHTPAEALGANAQRNDGLRRAWFWACKDEAIDPRAPTRLPLLFALDTKLAIEGGFSYHPDCRDIANKNDNDAAVYCGTDFSSGSSSGDADGFGGADGGGDGGGCGGD